MPKKIPTVRLATPAGRPIQLRYLDPETGKEIRITTGTNDEREAAEQKKDLEARLRLGVEAKPRRRAKGGQSMPWSDFRERYSELHLSTLRPKSAVNAESRLDIAERILKPRTLADVANSEALHELQQRLLDGAESRFKTARSPITARNYLVVVLAALNWAAYMEWLPAVPRVRKIKTAKLRQMKGRPITNAEFDAMIAATPKVVGNAAAPSWRYMLRGLWESGLRLGELLHAHWTDPTFIVPQWPADGLPVLAIPASMQKNDTEESIPLLPGFERLLLRTPDDQREGWVFNPLSLQGKVGRKIRQQRANIEWIGRVISDIGVNANVIVMPAAKGRSAKYASAHDLRRGCADRLISAGVAERDVAAIMRHASVETTRRHYAPGNVQRTAGAIRSKLATSCT